MTSPGLFNTPNNPPADGDFFPLKCISRAPNPLLQRVAFAKITDSAVVFFDNTNVPLFEKRFPYLDEAFWSQTMSQPSQTLSLSVACTESGTTSPFLLFLIRQCLQQTPLSNRNLVLATKIYAMDGTVAKLVPPTHPFTTLISDTLSALAYTDVAQVLSPVLDWSVRHQPSQEAKNISEVQQWLQSSLPPLVVIANTADPNLDIYQFDFRDDLEAHLDTVLSLPKKPIWPLKTVVCPSDGWLLSAVSNYEVHDRRRGGVPVIILSDELIKFLIAAIDAASGIDPEEAALRSLDAISASIKITIVHSLAHMWVTQGHTEDSPKRQDVSGAHSSKFQLAEDEDEPGIIEAGSLVETVWLGGPHILTLDQDGWLRVVIREATSSAALASSESAASSSSTASESGSELVESLSSYLLQRSRPALDTPADFEEPSSSSLVPSNPSGSAFELRENIVRSPIFFDQALVAVKEQDKVQYARVCDGEILRSLCAPGLPLFPGGIIGNLSPVVRAKGHRHFHAPNTTSRSKLRQPEPKQQHRHNVFTGGKVLPLCRQIEGLPPKWPSVLGSHKAEALTSTDRDHRERSTTPTTPRAIK
ncbi:hypothetical protein C8F01DRAFT_1246390 [Mycena amicta]|nr:hypothetical protein C8F01DRAFT_1246390 [Mycena amicta]